jgi:hypothetical protein
VEGRGWCSLSGKVKDLIHNPTIHLIIPHLRLFVIGGIAYYVDAIGKHGSSWHWCIRCMLQHPDWPVTDRRGEMDKKED